MKPKIKISLDKLKVESFVTAIKLQEQFTINGGRRGAAYGIAIRGADAVADTTIIVVNSNYCNSEPGVDCHAQTPLCSTNTKPLA